MKVARAVGTVVTTVTVGGTRRLMGPRFKRLYIWCSILLIPLMWTAARRCWSTFLQVPAVRAS